MKRACIFVDGENFRYSLRDLFGGGRFNHLPTTDWYAFFRGVVKHFDCELLRTYWYVTGLQDIAPRELPYPWSQKRALFSKSQEYRVRLDACGSDPQLERDTLKAIASELESHRRQVAGQFAGQQKIYSGTATQHDQIEFRRAGAITYDLLRRAYRQEKAVDTQLTTDMIELAPIYDVAILFSGDADYVPPTQAVKNRGRLVYSISFLSKDGNKLPGGAWRLENVVDKRWEITYGEMEVAMNLKPKVPAVAAAKAPTTTAAASTPSASGTPVS